MNFLKTHWKIITGTVVGALIIFCLVMLFTTNSKQFTQLKHDNLILQKQFDSLLEVHNQLTFKIDSIQSKDSVLLIQIDYNNQIIDANNRELNKYKKLYHEKINNIDHYSANDLDSFFRSRYHY
jgi:uncharacterized membrane protein required for colicin V production